MKRFSFKLQKILRLRAFREEQCKIELEQALGALNLIENVIKATAVKRHNAAAQRFADINEIGAWDAYILRLDQETERLMERAAQAQLVVEEKREKYIEASRALKALEKLKEKRVNEYRKESANLEMAEIDDLTAARYAADI
jgi:flagellar protein FliJ